MANTEGKHLVLLPGTLCDAELFAHQIEHLSDVAEAGVGDLTRDDSVAGMARTVLAAAPERFALAGLSMGGVVAFEVVRQAPERVEQLALLDTNPRPFTEEQSEAWRNFAGMTGDGRFAEVVEEHLLPGMLHPDHQTPPFQNVVRRMARNVGEEAYLRQISSQIYRPDSRGTLPEISCPTLVACGRQDALCPVGMHEEMAAAIPGSTLVVVETCGHLSSIEQPQAVTAVLRYWLEVN